MQCPLFANQQALKNCCSGTSYTSSRHSHSLTCIAEQSSWVQRQFAEAMAVQADGQIAAVGSDAQLLPLQQTTTAVQNMAGAFVMPVSTAYIIYCFHCFEQS